MLNPVYIYWRYPHLPGHLFPFTLAVYMSQTSVPCHVFKARDFAFINIIELTYISHLLYDKSILALVGPAKT